MHVLLTVVQGQLPPKRLLIQCPFYQHFSSLNQLITFVFVLIQMITNCLLQNFAHVTAAMLSWHVQNSVAIWWIACELQQQVILSNLNFWGENAWVAWPPGGHWYTWSSYDWKIGSMSDKHTKLAYAISCICYFGVNFKGINWNFGDSNSYQLIFFFMKFDIQKKYHDSCD